MSAATHLYIAAITFALGFGPVAALAASGISDSTEIAATLAARTSPADAIRAAEATTHGRATEFGLEDHDGTLAYEVRVAHADGLLRVTVDPATGTATVAPANREANAAPLLAALVDLATAVTEAERQVGGRALEARGSLASGQPAYEVEIIHAADAVQHVTVGGIDGRVVPAAADPYDTDAD
jgi:uncharacterized membrane protein YkoI